MIYKILLGNLYSHTHIRQKYRWHFRTLCFTSFSLPNVLHYTLPSAASSVPFAQCLPTRSRWFSGSRTQPPACPWLRKAVQLGVLHSPIRYALNLSLIQGHILFYLKVIMTLFLPKKLNLSKASRLVFFHFISNRPLFQRWRENMAKRQSLEHFWTYYFAPVSHTLSIA